MKMLKNNYGVAPLIGAIPLLWIIAGISALFLLIIGIAISSLVSLIKTPGPLGIPIYAILLILILIWLIMRRMR